MLGVGRNKNGHDCTVKACIGLELWLCVMLSLMGAESGKVCIILYIPKQSTSYALSHVPYQLGLRAPNRNLIFSFLVLLSYWPLTIVVLTFSLRRKFPC